MLGYLLNTDGGGTRRHDWNQAMREVYGPCWALDPVRPADFHMSMQAVQIGSLTLSRASLSAAQVMSRAPRVRRSHERAYNLYIVDRAQHVVLDGRSLILQPGDVTLADCAVPSTITTDLPYTTIGITVPAEVLRAYLPKPDRAVGMHFDGSNRITRVVSQMLRDMWSLAETGELAAVGHRLSVSLFEAFSACYDLAQPANVSGAVSATAVARRSQIRDAIQKRLRDPDFSVQQLGKELGLSTRYLQMMFSDGGESIRQYLRRERLEGCYRELQAPDSAEHSVTAIAFRWGFNSAAHFCRAFHAQYGVSPSRVREQTRSAQNRQSGLIGAPVAPGMRSGAVANR